MTKFTISDSVLALATHTAGWPVKHSIIHHESDGSRKESWTVEQGAMAASEVHAKLADSRPEHNLQRTAPEHPLLAARHGIEAVMTLEMWAAGKIGPPAVIRTSGRLLRCVPLTNRGYDLLPVVWPTLKPAVRVHDLAYAAGLIVCGFPVHPQIMPADGQQGPGFIFPAESITFHALKEEALRPGLGDAVRTDFPAGFPAGEHPFEYAFTGSRNYLSRHILMAPAEKNPTIFIKGAGTSGVLASQSLLEESHPNPAFRNRVHQFLS